MTDFLVYWKGFWGDISNLNEVIHGWNTKNESFYRQVENGDNLWVVVSGGQENPHEWRLLQRVFVDAPDPRQYKSKYGPYHIIGENKHSQLFELDSQPDFAPVLRKLEFASGKGITLKGRRIGQALQSIRPLAAADVGFLVGYSKTLRPYGP